MCQSVLHSAIVYYLASFPVIIRIWHNVLLLKFNNNATLDVIEQGWLGVSLFIYLFVCWSSRMTDLLLCYHSIAPCTSKDCISASAICHLWRFVFHFNI